MLNSIRHGFILLVFLSEDKFWKKEENTETLLWPLDWLYLILRHVTAFGSQVGRDAPSQEKIPFVSSQCEYTRTG